MSKGRKEFEEMVKKNRTTAMGILMKYDLSGGEFRVLMCLLSDAEDYNSSQSEIARKTGMSEHRVYTAMKQLEEKKFIEKLVPGSTGRKAEIKITLCRSAQEACASKQELSLPTGTESVLLSAELTKERLKKGTEERTEESRKTSSSGTRSTIEAEFGYRDLLGLQRWELPLEIKKVEDYKKGHWLKLSEAQQTKLIRYGKQLRSLLDTGILLQ